MEISIASQSKFTVVTIVGSIDSLTGGTFTDELKKQIEQGNTLLVADFSQVDYVSSAGLQALLGAVKESRQLGGDLVLASVQGSPSRVLEMSGFMDILKVFPDVDTAIDSL